MKNRIEEYFIKSKDSIFKNRKLLDYGNKKNSRGKLFYYVKYSFKNGKKIYLIEFLSTNKDYNNVAGIILFNGFISDKVIYLKKDLEVNDFFENWF